MANYANLKSDIAGVIRTNSNEEITGDTLQEQLLGMVDSLGAGFQYKGVATPATAPGTPDENVFYIASTAGTYTNFGGLAVADGEVAILKYNGSWAKEVSGAATAAQVTQLGQEIGDFDIRAKAIALRNLFEKVAFLSDATSEFDTFLSAWGLSDRVPVTGIELNMVTGELEVGNELTLQAIISPTNATNKNILWSTSNSAIASVSTNGVITAIAEGEATIIATTEDGGFQATFLLTVTEQKYSTLNYKFSDIQFVNGYIDDSGNLVESATDYLFDEFIQALGFVLLTSSGLLYSTNLTLRLAQYDSQKQFLRRSYNPNASYILGGSGEYAKFGLRENTFDNSLIFVGLGSLDTSLCTIANKSIDASGAETATTGTAISDFLEVTPEDGFIVAHHTSKNDSSLIVFYDSNKSLITRYANTTLKDNTSFVRALPQNAAYVRFRCNMNPAGSCYVSYITK